MGLLVTVDTGASFLPLPPAVLPAPAPAPVLVWGFTLPRELLWESSGVFAELLAGGGGVDEGIGRDAEKEATTDSSVGFARRGVSMICASSVDDNVLPISLDRKGSTPFLIDIAFSDLVLDLEVLLLLLTTAASTNVAVFVDFRRLSRGFIEVNTGFAFDEL